MKNILLFLLLLLFKYAHAQEQITTFENDSTKSPRNLIYLGTLNNKLLFTAFTPETGNEIWVSNGTEQGTQLLKDINIGELSTYPYSFIIHNSWAYFLVNGNIWKTDGTSANTFEIAKQDIENKISFVSLSILDNKVLLVSSRYTTTQLATFSWILPSNEIEQWEDEVLGYSIETNSLFYSKTTNEAYPTYTIYHYLQSSKAIYSTKLWITGLNQFKNNSDIYCSLTTGYSTDLQRVLIKIDENQKLKNQVLDWGNHQNLVPLYTKDEKGTFYLVKSNSYKNNIDYSLSLYKVNADGLSLTYNIYGKEINPTFSFTGGQHFYSNTIFQNDKLFYVNGFYVTGGRVFYCNYIDFKNNILKQANTIHADSYDAAKVTTLNDSLFKVNTAYVTFFYNSKSNLITGKTFRPFTIEKTFTKLNNQEFEISDNIYKLIVNDKSPLIEQKKIYFGNSSPNLQNIEYNGKLYMLYENYFLKKSELWALEGLKGKKIKSFSNINYGGYFFQVKNLSDKLFFTVNDSLNFNIYQTDGTTIGTTLAYSFSNKDFSSGVRVNDNYIQLIYNTKHIFISKEGIDEIPNDGLYTYFASENIYSIRYFDSKAVLYKLEKGKLRTLFSSNSISDPFIFKNRLYFKSNKQLIYVNESDEVVNISRNVDYYTKSNDFLIYREYSYTNNSTYFYTHSVFDLRTHKVVSNYVAEAGNISFYFNNSVGAYKVGNSKIAVFDGKDTYDVLSLTTGLLGTPIYYKNGFLIQYSATSNSEPNILVYYDLQEKRFYNILNNSTRFSIKVNEHSDFILIEQYSSNNERIYSIWNYESKTVKQVPTEKNEYFYYELPAGNYTKSYINNNVFLWSYSNDNLLRQEPTRKKLNQIRLEDIVTNELKFLPERGNELFAIGNGFCIYFPEIVKGSEGIGLGNTFIFNNQLYAYLFT